MSGDERNYDLKAAPQARIAAPSLLYEPPTPSTNHRIGLIGCGGVTEFHLRAYRDAGFDVVALADVVAERAITRRDQFFPTATVHDDYREVLRRSDIDVVDVATHAEPRVQIIQAALNRGKHVLSQKPFVVDLATGVRLASLAEQCGRLLAVNQNGRWAPHLSYMREAVRAGLIGDVVDVNVNIHWDHNWVKDTPFDDMQHLILCDFAIHWFDFLASIVPGLPRHLTATEARSVSQTARPPLLATVLLQFTDARATLCFDADTRYGPEDRTVVRGTQGTLYSVGPDLTEQTVTGYVADGWFRPELRGTWFHEGFAGAMGELLCAIEQGRTPQHNARDNLRGLAMCFASARSADTGGSVDVTVPR